MITCRLQMIDVTGEIAGNYRRIQFISYKLHHMKGKNPKIINLALFVCLVYNCYPIPYFHILIPVSILLIKSKKPI
jgi:hypothetical protein